MGRKIKRKSAKKAKQIEKTEDLGCRDLYRIDVPEKSGIRIGKLHGIGSREKQQDAFGISDIRDIEKKGMLFVLADGMGGLFGGETASMETVVACLTYFDRREMDEELPDYFTGMLEYANERVRRALDCDAGDGGSTVIAVWIGDGYMFYGSVGDSRLLLCRNENLIRLNREHNYGTVLLEQAMQGEIGLEEAYKNPQKNALTSYIGESVISEIDICREAVKLESGDKIILLSDGVYRTVGEEEMKDILKQTPQTAAMQLERLIFEKEKASQDNYTALIVEVISNNKD